MRVKRRDGRSSRRGSDPAGRRDFLRAGLLVATGLGTPSWAQVPGKMYRVVIVRDGSAPPEAPRSDRFERLLAAHGFALGRNLRVDYVFTESKPEDLPQKLRAAVASRPDVIFTAFSYRVKLLQAETREIPIVFWAAGDPVKTGIVREYARPGGNATGVAFLYEEAAAKRLEIARELLPHARRIALIADYGMMKSVLPTWPTDLELQARRVGLEIVPGDVSAHGGNLAETLDTILKSRPDAVLSFGVLPTASDRGPVLEDFEKRQRIPLIGDIPGFGVVAFGADEDDHYRRAVEVVARILKGAKPEELPVDRDTRFELTVNSGTAKAIGLRIPPAILVRADRVLQ